MILLVQVLEKGDGVIALEIADAFGDCPIRQLSEDFVANMRVHLGQGREIEIRPHQLDELGAEVGRKRDKKSAEVGFVQIAGERADAARVGRLDRGRHVMEELRLDCAIFIVDQSGVAGEPVMGGRGKVLVFDMGHA